MIKCNPSNQYRAKWCAGKQRCRGNKEGSSAICQGLPGICHQLYETMHQNQ